ncbi:MAG TPA: cytochrome ubiquinol oxidase subunit I, partial [Bacteroidales bacterium]|nr:cytochrome ubiquinol oxidase subunit I [Bacteroidales bacterium]
MNYPVWELPSLGGGTLIAIIAVIHSFIAHLAVGGGLFLVLTEIKARKNNDAALLGYVKAHTKFFLLLTMVFGGITGVGIWFIISLVQPAATSSLIHNFVFGWATEWVFFIAEIVALLIYHYRFDKMNPKDHVRVGWLYFIFAWLSLFVINGILGFMLTPGRWLETQSFWEGFFNPSFWPALIFRTGIALSIAGIFGLVTASFRKDKQLRQRLYKMNAKWLYFPFILIALTAIWYLAIIPANAEANILRFNPAVKPWYIVWAVATGAIFLIGIFFLVRLPVMLQRVTVFVLVLTGLAWMGGFEYTREIARKPYVIYGHMYSNSILKSDLQKINQEGFLITAKWAEVKEVTNENMLEAGAEISRLQCMACHTMGGYNDLISRTSHLTERGMEAKLTGLGQVNDYMPPFAGTEKEKKALAAYILRDIHGEEAPEPYSATVEPEPVEIPPFDQDSKYVLLAWNDLGMHCISDNSDYWSFLPPANTLWAQLIKRGPKPEIISDGVKLHYEVEEGFKHPEKHVD